MRRLTAANSAPVVVLFYHRIADTHPNGWTMPVEVFRLQLDWLAENFDLVSLSEAQRRLRDGSDKPSVAITFDDGYADNCDTAIPLLLRRNVPFTYFVSTRIVEEQLAFPHDLEAGVRLKPNSVPEIRAMAEAGVEIGAHTRTHVDMGRSTDLDWIREELVGSIEDIRHWTGKPPRYFAFPFGQPHQLTPEACEAAYQAGIEGVCSAYGAYNLPNRVSSDHGPFHLRRVHADPEWARFTNWMTFDPRKLRRRDPIDDNKFLPELKAIQESETLPNKSGAPVG